MGWIISKYSFFTFWKFHLRHCSFWSSLWSRWRWIFSIWIYWIEVNDFLEGEKKSDYIELAHTNSRISFIIRKFFNLPYNVSSNVCSNWPQKWVCYSRSIPLERCESIQPKKTGECAVEFVWLASDAMSMFEINEYEIRLNRWVSVANVDRVGVENAALG